MISLFGPKFDNYLTWFFLKFTQVAVYLDNTQIKGPFALKHEFEMIFLQCKNLKTVPPKSLDMLTPFFQKEMACIVQIFMTIAMITLSLGLNLLFVFN